MLCIQLLWQSSIGLWQWFVSVVNIIFNLFYNFCHICADNPRMHSCQCVRVFHLLVVLNVHWEQSECSECFPAAMVCVMALLPALSIRSLSVKILYLPCQCVWMKCIVQHIHSVCFGQLFLPLYSLPHFLISCCIFCFYFSCCYSSRLCGSYFTFSILNIYLCFLFPNCPFTSVFSSPCWLPSCPFSSLR